MSIDGGTAAAVAGALVFSFTFDADDNVTATQTYVGTEPSTSILSVSDALGVTVYGGCSNCSGTSWLPTFTSSDCPSVGPGARTVAKVSVPNARILVNMPFVVTALCDSAPAPLHNLALNASVSSLPPHGSLWMLDNATAVTVGSRLDIFNGTNTVRLNGSSCAVYGVALVLFQPPASLTTLVTSPTSFNYSVSARNMTSATFTTVSSSPAEVLVLRKSPLVLVDPTVPSTTIGAQNVFSVGLQDPGAVTSCRCLTCAPP